MWDLIGSAANNAAALVLSFASASEQQAAGERFNLMGDKTRNKATSNLTSSASNPIACLKLQTTW